MERFFENNMELLRQKDRQLYNTVKAYSPQTIGEVIPTKTVPSFRFNRPGGRYAYAYDPTDPLADIQDKLPVLKNKNNLNETVCIMTGFGLGHIPKVVLEGRQDLFRLIILEPCLDMFCLALTYTDLTSLFVSQKVFIFAGEIDWKRFDETINRKTIETDFLFSDFSALFDWNPTLYNDTKNKARAYAVRAISGMGVLGIHGEHIFKNRIRNLMLFKEASYADRLKGAFKGKPAILVSAGPSLDRSIPYLKSALGKCVMIAVDSALVPLLRNGIKPDFVTTLDYRELNSEKLSPDLVNSKDFSLVSVITASVPTARRLALKNLFFCFQDNDTQSWLLDALDVKYLMEPVGTVASLNLSFAQMIGADPIVMVGYDFALTAENTDHVGGVVFNHGWHQQEGSIIVKGVDGGEVRTLDFLLEFKQNFEQNLSRHYSQYINATAAGAHIEGTTVQSMEAVLQHILTTPMNVDADVQSVLEKAPSVSLSHLLNSMQRQIKIAKTSLKQVHAIEKLNQLVLDAVGRQQKRADRIRGLSGLPPALQKNKRKLNKLYGKLKPFMPMEEIAAKKIHEARSLEQTEIASTYIETIQKESKVLALEMAGHAHGIAVFLESVENLVSFLEKERHIHDRLEGLNEKEISAFLELSLSEMCPIKAESLLNDPYVALQIPPARKYYYMGTIYAQLLQFEDAFQYWEKAQELNPEIAEKVRIEQRNLAEYWLERGKFESSIMEKCLRRALTLCQEKEFVLEVKEVGWEMFVGWMDRWIRREKRIEHAESYLLLWEPIKESTPDWNYWMAWIISEKEEKEGALLYLETNLLNPYDHETGWANYPTWLTFSARLLIETGQFDEGIERLQQAVALDANQAVLWEELGDTLFDQNDYTSAAMAYEKCYVALPDKIDVLRKFGDSYFHLGQAEAAKTAYQAVLDKDPSNEAAKDALTRVNGCSF